MTKSSCLIDKFRCNIRKNVNQSFKFTTTQSPSADLNKLRHQQPTTFCMVPIPPQSSPDHETKGGSLTTGPDHKQKRKIDWEMKTKTHAQIFPISWISIKRMEGGGGRWKKRPQGGISAPPRSRINRKGGIFTSDLLRSTGPSDCRSRISLTPKIAAPKNQHISAKECISRLGRQREARDPLCSPVDGGRHGHHHPTGHPPPRERRQRRCRGAMRHGGRPQRHGDPSTVTASAKISTRRTGS